MSLILSPVGSDNFQRANESPLSQGGNWITFGSFNLAVISDVCETATVSGLGGEFYEPTSLPANQYCLATIQTSFGGGVFYLGIRSDGTLVNNQPTGYILEVEPLLSRAVLSVRTNAAGNTLAIYTGLTCNNGDTWVVAAIGTTVYVLQNNVQIGSVTDSTLSSGVAWLYQENNGSFQGDTQTTYFEIGSAALGATFSISGNAGVASATVSWSGTSMGSVTADGSGNYSITGLSAGNYTLTPSLAGFSFSPPSQNETISSSNITGVNFTATATSGAWSPVDSRVHKPNFATFRVVNGAQIDDQQTSSNPAVPGTDSRKAGAPLECGSAPRNSRTPPPFKS